MNAPRILLVSNGFGEMAILETIARAIVQRRPVASLAHMALVGHIDAQAWPPPVGPQAAMPSGGLVTYWNARNIVRDVRAGLVGLTFSQFAYLRRHGCEYDVAVAVGDIYCLLVCRWFTRLPTVFVATAKSEYVAPHGPFEVAIARGASLTFARDGATADALRACGVNAKYAGNAMMDGVARAEFDLPLSPDAIRVALLPGSRADAAGNAAAAARRLVRIAELAGRQVQVFLALAPAADARAIAGALADEGFALEETSAIAGIVGRAKRDGVEILVVRGGLAASLAASEIVIGQAGTGNEQAAGLGKPVIAAAGPGESPRSVGWYRMRQQRLLGDALAVFPSDDEAFAQETLRLLADPDRRAAMSAAGKARMGAPGASAAIADAVLAVADEANAL